MSDGIRAWLLRVAGALPLVGLVATVLGVATVAMYAESQKAWGAYLLMERAMAVGADVAVPLLGLWLVGGFGLVYAAPRFEAD